MEGFYRGKKGMEEALLCDIMVYRVMNRVIVARDTGLPEPVPFEDGRPEPGTGVVFPGIKRER